MMKHRAILKWAGGKYGLVERIKKVLPPGKCLIEPFAGACSVFLNTDYDEYILNDINSDLIDMFNHIKAEPERFITEARAYFEDSFNEEGCYYRLRAELNESTDTWKRSLLFLYLNRHGYNGLCRYNQKGGFNVPYGRYKKTYFPEDEIRHFAEKAKKATFVCKPFQDLFEKLREGDVLYCDPPYVPLPDQSTKVFTAYTKGGFSLEDQDILAGLVRKVSNPVLISNHDTEFTRALYKGAQLTAVNVARTISSDIKNRKPEGEVLALFNYPK